MRYVLVTALLGALVCVGCKKPQGPQTTEMAPPTETAAGPKGLKALEPPGAEAPIPLTAADPAPWPEPEPAPLPRAEPVVAARPVEPESPRFYVVQKGDTLWRIAAKVYGNGQRYRDILAANPGLVPTRMPVGSKLLIPNE
jgi:5'-nucleotidase/UDP-sugar diphosphatase